MIFIYVIAVYVSSDPGTYIVRIRFAFKTGCDMMLFGIPNLNIMSCMNSAVLAEVREVMGLNSIHLVNLSIATST
jgi:hypothetical protein